MCCGVYWKVECIHHRTPTGNWMLDNTSLFFFFPAEPDLCGPWITGGSFWQFQVSMWIWLASSSNVYHIVFLNVSQTWLLTLLCTYGFFVVSHVISSSESTAWLWQHEHLVVFRWLLGLWKHALQPLIYTAFCVSAAPLLWMDCTENVTPVSEWNHHNMTLKLLDR